MMQERAALVTEYCDDPRKGLQVRNVETLEPDEDDDVIINVESCGVNYPDLLLVQGKYQFKPELPFSPGGEVSGVVAKTGSESGYQVGDRVIATTMYGGFATQVRAKAAQCLPMPDYLSYETASAFIVTYGTTLYALRNRGNLKSHETLVILGAGGGVGTAAIEIAKKVIGCKKVIACASSDEKLRLCKVLGADETINYTTCKNLKSAIRNLTDGNGADVVYDPVGGNKLPEACLRAMNFNGRYLVIGFASGIIPKLPLNLPLLKSTSIVGVFWGGWRMKDDEGYNESNEQINEIVQYIRRGVLSPTITKRYSLQDSGQCLHNFAQRKVSGKVVIQIDRPQQKQIISKL